MVFRHGGNTVSSEAEVIGELVHHLKSALEDNPSYYRTTYERVRQEVNTGNGFADVVLEESGGSPFIVIEAKRPPEEGESTRRDIDPYSQPVISQAAGYAMELGAHTSPPTMPGIL